MARDSPYLDDRGGVSGRSVFLVLLTALFAGLRLGGVIAWSWWWVFTPVLTELAPYLLALAVGHDLLWFRHDPGRAPG
jgi:cytochrome c biogenesis factor